MAVEMIPLEKLPPIDPEADQNILLELTDTVVPLINRHINPARFSNEATKHEFPTVTDYMGDNADLWTPAMMVPWTLGQNFPENYVWTPEESPLPDAATRALILGLLTEDAVPWYSEAIVRKFGANEAMRFFANVWTSEELRHAEVIHGLVVVGRLVDQTEIDRDRTANIITAQVPDPPSAMESLIYVALQELATRISHQNTGKLIADTARADDRLVALSKDKTTLANVEPTAIDRLEPELREAYIRQVSRTVFTRVAGDENKHHVFYRDSVGDRFGNGALKIDASTIVKALEKQIRGFQMPGTGIRNFAEHAQIVAEAGVYDKIIHHNLLDLMVRHWRIDSLEDLDGEAEQARDRIFSELARLSRKALLYEERRDAKRAAAIDDPEVIWVGKKPA